MTITEEEINCNGILKGCPTRAHIISFHFDAGYMTVRLNRMMPRLNKTTDSGTSSTQQRTGGTRS